MTPEAIIQLPLPVAVVIVTWNCQSTLDGCLEALAHTEPGPPGQVICVDNASADDSVATARRHGVDVVELGRNTGFAHAVNTVLPRVAQPFTLLLNPDVVVEPATIRVALAALQADPSVGLVGANLRLPDGRTDLAAARRFRTLGLLALETTGVTQLSRRFDLQYLPGWDRRTSRDVPCINGAFAMLSTDSDSEGEQRLGRDGVLVSRGAGVVPPGRHPWASCRVRGRRSRPARRPVQQFARPPQ